MKSLVLAAVVLIGTAGLAEAKHYYNTFCGGCAQYRASGGESGEAANCSEILPPDPRRLATHANGYTSEFVPCHDAIPEGYAMPNGNELRWPKDGVSSCGDWLDFAAEGKRILQEEALIGTVGAGSLENYRNLWQAWGVAEAPDQASFEKIVVERYGMQKAPFNNPYPTAADLQAGNQWKQTGGSGQLPVGLVQNYVINAQGQKEYSDSASLTCLWCHTTRIQTDPDRQDEAGYVGLGDSTFDAEVYQADSSKVSGTPFPLPYPHNSTRGGINAVSDFEFLMVVRDFDTLDLSPFVKTFPVHAHPGDQDPPNWWNTGMRPRVYMDGGVPAESTRAIMMFLSGDLGANGVAIANQEQRFEAIKTFVNSVEAPRFPASDDAQNPRHVDAGLAETGKALFHMRSLFPGGNQPYGNGSCASCHGVYDAAYAIPFDRDGDSFGPMPPQTKNLSQADRNRLVGIAAQIVPLNVIGTQPGRVDNLTYELRWAWSTMWWAYPDFNPEYTPPSEKDPLTEALDDYAVAETNDLVGLVLPKRVQGICSWEQETYGYTAPPLHGIWASSPYFHNGSVPTVRGVLDPDTRPRFWRRKLSEGVLLANGEREAGFSTSLGDYDFANLGWQVDVTGLDECGVPPLIPCDPSQEPLNQVIETAHQLQGGVVWLGLQEPDPMSRADIERRKIYDTRLYGKSNRGHEFTRALGDPEREAIIEYLKTL